MSINTPQRFSDALVCLRKLRSSRKWLSIQSGKGSQVFLRVSLGLAGLGIWGSGVVGDGAIAQIIPDNSLPTPSQVSPDPGNPNFLRITSGTQPPGSSDLFHSFSVFNLSAGQTALFDLSPTIATIFARVTGDQGSNIDGTIAATGNTNLFLLNPNGILFGANARLDLGGSFLATTANSIQFEQGFFSATQANTPPLLTVNLPVGLQMGNVPGAIEVQGTGHTLAGGPFSSISNNSTSQLQVNPGQTLALVGGNLVLNGGTLTAASGRVELGAVGDNTTNPVVRLNANNTGFTLDFDNIANFGQIDLNQKSLVDVSSETGAGTAAGSIQVNGATLNLTGGSLLLSQNSALTTQPAGAIVVNATEHLSATGISDIGATNDNQFIPSGIITSTYGTGHGGNIVISTRNFEMRDGAFTATRTFGSGLGGNIDVSASETIQFSGFGVEEERAANLLTTLAFADGDGGDITVSSDRIKLTDGSAFNVGTFELGKAGEVFVQADVIELIGTRPNTILISNIGTSTLVNGPGGDLTINARQVFVQDGARISPTSTGAGSSGNLLITASERVTVQGSTPENTKVSDIGAFVDLVDEATKRLFELPDFPSGNAGRVTIRVPELRILDGATVSVGNEGSGDGGDLTIESNSIFLDNQGRIGATTVSGQGGNIQLQASESLVLRHGSQITTAAGGAGDGGNITINAPFVVAPPAENSDIVANAVEGDGGNIQINATGILGIESRQSSTDKSDIVASSEFGTSGTINLTRPDVDISSGLVPLSSQFADVSNQLAPQCVTEGSSFTATGRGGLPENPTAVIRGQTLWQEDTPGIAQTGVSEQTALQEATSWSQDSQGNLVLVANNPTVPVVLPVLAPSRQITVAQALTQQGRDLFAQGQMDEALTTWRQAEQAYLQEGNGMGQQGNRLNQAQALQALGQYRRAAALLHNLVADLDSQPASLLKVKALRSLGVVLQANGDLGQAKDILEQSWAMSQQLGFSEETAATWFSLGNLARDVQQPNAAIPYYIEAARSSPDPLLQVQAQLNLLSVWIETQQWQEIDRLLPQLQNMLQQLPLNRASTYAHLNFADRLVQILQQESQQDNPIPTPWQNHEFSTIILTSLTTALHQGEQLKDQRVQAYALQQLGNFYLHEQRWHQAQQFTEQSLHLAQTLDAPDLSAIAAQQLGQIFKHQGELSQAITAYHLAFTALQTLRTDLVATNPDVQFSLRDQVEPIYREYVSLLLTNPNPSNTKHQPQNPNFPIPHFNLAQARDVIEALQLAQLDNFFGEACLNAQPVQIDQIDTQAAVVYPIILGDRLEVILSLPNQPLFHYTTYLPEAIVEDTIGKFLSSLHPGMFESNRLPLAQQLYDWLIQPAAPALEAAHIQTLVFVSDGVLRNVPMAALHDGRSYLIERYAISLSPGLQLLPQSARQQNNGLLVGAIAQAHQGFNPLPGVEQEVEAIAREHQAQVLLNEQFTRQNFQTALSQAPFPIVHLATHAQFSADPDQTFLLAWNDRINVRDLGELFQSHRNMSENSVELLVMSACQTAAGDDRSTLGLAGFALRSGARSTVASLWAVDDQATAELMTAFYRQLIQTRQDKTANTYPTNSEKPGEHPITTVEALRQAQLTLLHNQNPFYAKNPYFWAGFVLVGNWL